MPLDLLSAAITGAPAPPDLPADSTTFSENGLSMRAGLATLEVLQDEALTSRAERLGAELRTQFTSRLSRFERVSGIRGLGLLNGIVMRPPTSLKLRLAFQTFPTIHPGMFGQMLVRRLFNQHNILSQICGNNFMVLKVAPPLVITESQLARFLDSIESVMEAIQTSSSFWSDALNLAQRAVRV